MSYNLEIADKVRVALADNEDVEQKQMFGALGFMVNGRLTICVGKDDVMYKVGPKVASEAVKSGKAEPVIMGTRVMKSWVNVSTVSLSKDEYFMKWLTSSLTYNLTS